MAKTIARGGDDGARVVSLGATCYGACVASVAVRSRDEGDENTAREMGPTDAVDSALFVARTRRPATSRETRERTWNRCNSS